MCDSLPAVAFTHTANTQDDMPKSCRQWRSFPLVRCQHGAYANMNQWTCAQRTANTVVPTKLQEILSVLKGPARCQCISLSGRLVLLLWQATSNSADILYSILAYPAQALVKNLIRPASAILSLAGCTHLQMEPCSMDFSIEFRICCTCRRAVDERRYGGLHFGVHSLCACGQDD